MSPEAVRSLDRQPTSTEIPLTYAQRWTWGYRWLSGALEPGTSTRSAAIAIHLTGQLHVDMLVRCIVKITKRHDALRTNFVGLNHTPHQVTDDDGETEFDFFDCSEFAIARCESEGRRLISEIVHEVYALDAGSLFKARLIRLTDYAHVLGIAMDHLISDAASFGIFFHELWTLYAQLIRGSEPSLPDIEMQYSQYALRQLQNRQAWLSNHGGYWQRRLGGARRLQLFVDRKSQQPRRVCISTVPVSFSESTVQRLRELCRVQKSMLSLVMLTAFVALISAWSDTSDLVVTLVSSARLSSRVKSTIGYFGAPLYLRMQVNREDRWHTLLEQVGSEYTAATVHADSGLVAVQPPIPEFATNPRFNWIPREFSLRPCGSIAGTQLTQSPFPIAPRCDFDDRGGAPELLLTDTGSGVNGVIWYRDDLGHRSTVERFAAELTQMVDQFASDPASTISRASAAVGVGEINASPA